MHLAKLVQVEVFWLFYQILSSIMYLALNGILACGNYFVYVGFEVLDDVLVVTTSQHDCLF